MAHIAKYQSGALGNMCAHYDRWNGDLSKAESRDNIDATQTHLNFNLAPNRNCGQVKFIRERIESLNLNRLRKDAVRMCDCVLTKPKSLDPAKTDEFFRAGYEFLKARYGGEDAKNVVSAWVHMDEPKGQPHMHFAFVPVTKDGRLSAKDVITRADLRTLHTDMQRFVERELGCEVEIILSDEKVVEKALSSVSQKQLDVVRAELTNEIEEKALEREELNIEVAALTERAEELRGTLSALQQQFDTLVRHLAEIADAMKVRMWPGDWKNKLAALRDNPIAQNALRAGQPWESERDYKRADKSVKKDVKQANRSLSEMKAEVERASRALENQPSSRENREYWER